MLSGPWAARMARSRAGDVIERRVPGRLVPGVQRLRAVVAHQGCGQPVGGVDEVEAEAPLDTQVAAVNRVIEAAVDAVNELVFDK
jgi:hypothetical protein